MNESERIEAILKRSKMLKKDFAKRVGISGVYLKMLMDGTNEPSLKLLKKICEEFPDYNEQWIMLGEGKPLKNSDIEFGGEKVAQEVAQGGKTALELLKEQNDYLRSKVDELLTILSNQSKALASLGKADVQLEASFVSLYPVENRLQSRLHRVA